MKKLLSTFLMAFMVVASYAQGMSDSEVMEFIKREAEAGTSQSSIVTKLMQRGVNIDQIRRLRNQYDSQISNRGMQGAADRAVGMAADRMRANNDGTSTQELNSGQVGTTTTTYSDAAGEVAEVENDVKATSGSNDGRGKQVFGRNIFNNRRLTFEPNMNIATPQNYVLGPGDQVVVDIYGASQKTMTLQISPEGTITVPGYGPLTVSGLSVAAAQQRIRQRVGARYSSSEIRLTLGQTRTIMVNIMGEVAAPGTYHLSAFASVFHALYMAGGISSLGTLRNIKVYRNGKLVTVVDVYEYILNGRLAGNIMLQEGDVIKVDPYEALVGVTGNVKRPMFYEMRSNETVATLIGFAGGFTGDAYKKSVRLVRQTGERYAVYNVGEFDQASFRIEDGDAIAVDGMLNRFENMVELNGAVFRPGQYRIGEGINTIKDLISQAEGPTEDAFLGHVVIHRLKPDRTLEVIPVDLQSVIDGNSPDVALQNEDVVFVPTQEELRKNRTLRITGQVLTPGTYEYADNTTIEDLIVMAGGLTDQASTARVDVSRRIMDPKALNTTREIAKTFTFSLKEGLVVDGDRSFVLEPYDIVHVRRSPAYRSPRQISVSGEVVFEGAFTLENKDQRISDAIAKAGGITESAYLRGARLYRVPNEEERIRMASTRAAIANVLGERRDSINWGSLESQGSYLLAVDIEKALAKPGSDYDVVLREGDHIIIPEYNSAVRVSGDIMFPNTVFYEKGKGYKWYVAQAGGFGHRAKKKKSFIVYQNGQVGLVRRGAKPEPGCEIVIPSKKKRNPVNISALLAAGTSLSTIAAMVATIASMTK